MKELYESRVLDDIYETRRDGFENMLLEKEEPAKIKNANLLYDKAIEKIRDRIKDGNEKEELMHLIEELDDAWIDKMCYWQQQYYKLGFCDAYNLRLDVCKERQNFSIKERLLTLEYDSFSEFFEMYKSNHLYKEREYINIEERIKQIKIKYPKVRAFIEDGMLDRFSDREEEAILTIIKLEGEIEALEIKEAFKLGMVEGNIL